MSAFAILSTFCSAVSEIKPCFGAFPDEFFGNLRRRQRRCFTRALSAGKFHQIIPILPPCRNFHGPHDRELRGISRTVSPASSAASIRPFAITRVSLPDATRVSLVVLSEAN